jgi:hypothetical protein
MGYRQVRKNTLSIPVSVRVGYECHPQVKNCPLTQPRRIGYPVPVPELPSLLLALYLYSKIIKPCMIHTFCPYPSEKKWN